jgi:hypothetical protein
MEKKENLQNFDFAGIIENHKNDVSWSKKNGFLFVNICNYMI